MNTTPVRLPTISEIDRAYHRLGQFISDLDMLAAATEQFATGESVPIEDYVFMRDNGIAVGDDATSAARRETDPAVIARLLVLAIELEDDADEIRKDAARLREQAVTAYREYVIERHLYRTDHHDDDSRNEDDDAS
jgi:hypothetical protein